MTVGDFLNGRLAERQAVTRYINRHPEIFDGHVTKVGKELDLDDFAVEQLGKQYPLIDSLAIIKGVPQEEHDKVKEERDVLLQKVAVQADQIAKLAQWKADNAVTIAEANQTKLLLDNAQRDVKLLEGFVADAKAEISVLNGERDEAREMVQRTQEELSEASERSQRAEKRNRVLEEYAAACKAYNELPGWRRAFTKPPVLPDLQEE